MEATGNRDALEPSRTRADAAMHALQPGIETILSRELLADISMSLHRMESPGKA